MLDIKRGQNLKLLDKLDKEQLAQLLDALPDDAKSDLGGRPSTAVDHQWLWRPIGNEELYVTRLCSGLGQRPACGVLIDRVVLGRAKVLGWASSRHWLPSVETDRDARDLWMIGGDETGTYQRLIQYRYGTIANHRRRASPARKHEEEKRRRAEHALRFARPR